ncbi:MAG: hypothetical protein CMP16_01480, partial [Rickettsiales bacterium]|nr:hypothetical protein [Rickettsiales bacterium]
SNFNKKKISLLPNRRVLKYFFIIIFIFVFLVFTYYELRNKDRFYNIIQNLSEKFNYQFLNIEINSLNRVNQSDVLKILNKYISKSIFLIPLNDISKSLIELNWVKSVNLSTDFKNKVKVQIFEHTPIGLFFYNNQLFYFSADGKIIDKFREKINENFIIFHGKQVLKEANNFLDSLDKIENINIIKEAYYINQRRWDVKLNNEIILNLEEKNIEESINNYIKLIEKFNKSEILLIKNMDLRNNEKAIISFK